MNLRPAERVRLLAAAAALACTGCSDGDSAAPFAELNVTAPQAGPVEDTGSLSLALTAQNGAQFEAFSWVVTGPNFSRSGSIDFSNSSTISARIDGMPEAAGYSITLFGTSSLPVQATCSGSESFAITAGAVTNVSLGIACHLLAPRASP